MANPLSYYEKIKNEQHVFIYCVAGRSSSTAFQRIINSSNKVWVWGERHGMVDDTVELINHMKTYRDNDFVKASLTHMYDSFTSNKHLSFYPNAIGNLDSTINIINSSLSNMLKPWAPALKRFGFKDIEVKNIHTLEYLKEIFPQSFFLYCFRNPLTQWPSVHKLEDWWPYGKEVQAFLDEYYRLSNIYLDFASKTGNIFIENNDLKNEDKVKKIIHHLNIPKIDYSLINVTVSSVKGSDLSKAEEDTILN